MPCSYVAGLNVSHNTITNSSYSGMTVGWGWGREGSARGNNHVVANRIESVQTKRCCDGGGIYTLGPQPGSTLHRNYLLHHESLGGGNAIYHDNGSGGFTDTENVIDGGWGSFLAVNGPLGPFGPGKTCPGPGPPVGTAADCGIVNSGNWLRTNAHGKGSSGNVSVHDNIKVDTHGDLPAAAAQVVKEAGVRSSARIWD